MVMNTLKYLIIAILSLLLLIIIAVVSLSYFVPDREESSKIQQLTFRAISEIKSYYDQNHFYPNSLSVLPISKNKEFTTYHN